MAKATKSKSKNPTGAIIVASHRSLGERWRELTVVQRVLGACLMLIVLAGVLTVIALVQRPQSSTQKPARVSYKQYASNELTRFSQEEKAPTDTSSVAETENYYLTQLDLQVGAGQNKEAIKTYEILIDKYANGPSNFDAHALVAQAYHALDDKAGAKQALDKAVASANQLTDADAKSNALRSLQETRDRWGL